MMIDELRDHARMYFMKEQTHHAEACRYALLLGGVAAQAAKQLKKDKAYTRWCESVGVNYRHMRIRVRAWEQFTQGHHIHDIDLSTFPVRDNVDKAHRLISAMTAFVDGRSFNALCADLGLVPSRSAYTNVRKHQVTHWKALVEVCRQYRDQLPEPVREVLSLMEGGSDE